MASTLKSLVEQLDQFGNGTVSLDALREWFTPFQAAFPPERLEEERAVWSLEQDDQALFWNLVWAFEDDSIPEAELREVAQRVVTCVRGLQNSAAALDLLPLIRHRCRFSIVVAKHRRGIISRTGLVSVIGKTFRHDEVRVWLATAALSELEDLCRRLDDGDYREVVALLSRPPA